MEISTTINIGLPSMTPEITPPTIISTPGALRRLVEQLMTEPLIAVDTESNSLFAYYERVCLIQISTREADWVVDPLALTDLTLLAPIFANPSIEKVFHAAEYDIICLKRDYQFRFENLFDTMMAARIAGLKSWGLGALLEQYFGVQVDKRFQRADWSARPMPADQLHYAQMDTHYLPMLRDTLQVVLAEKGATEEAREIFDQLVQAPAHNHRFDPDGYWKINAARNLNRRQFAVLREVYLLRETLAQQSDKPAFKVLTDDALVNLARIQPKQASELRAIAGLSPKLARVQGETLLEAIARGIAAPLPNRPDPAPRVETEIQTRYDALHEWRKTRATKRGVESDVILPKEAMWAMARQMPRTLEDLAQIPGLGPWKRAQYGEDLLALLAKFTVK